MGRYEVGPQKHADDHVGLNPADQDLVGIVMLNPAQVRLRVEEPQFRERLPKIVVASAIDRVPPARIEIVTAIEVDA